MERLTEEIHRVLSSPYAVSLKGLLNAMCEADAHLLELWTLSHPCEIEMLVSVVTDSLSWCPFAMSVLENLVTAERLRNSFLRQRPALLDTLLKKAVVSQQSFEKYSQICVSMLSAPLSVPIPVSSGPFFYRRLEEAARSPTTSSLRQIYALVSGQRSVLSDILPAGHIIQIQERLISILKRLDGQSVHLFCLGTFARLVAPQRCRPSSVDNASLSSISSIGSGSSDVEKSLDLIKGFFSAQKASKTIDLVVLRVISSCSSNSDLPDDEALENVELATTIMDAVEPDVRGAWVKANGRTMRKLYEKVLRSGISSLLQFAAFRFILCMVDAKSLPIAFPKSFQTLICNKLQRRNVDNHSICLSADILEKMAPCFDEDFVSEVLRIILTTVTQPESSIAYVSQLKDCQTFLDGMNGVVEGSSTFRKDLLSALSTNELAEPLRGFCETSILEQRPTDGCSNLKLCWTELQESRRNLAASFCLLILKVALHSSGDDVGLETSLGLSLLRKQRDITVPMSPCPSTRYRHANVEIFSATFLEQRSTPQDVRASYEWKSRLAEGLMRDAAQRHELIVKTVSEVCRELEERCENIEGPLREAKEKLGSVQACLDESIRRGAALEVEASERELFLDGLEAEKQRLESNISSFSQQVEELERLLRQAVDEKENTKVAARDEAKKLELNHLAILTDKGEVITELEQEIRKLGDELGLSRKKESEVQESLVVLQKELAESSTELEQEKAISLLKRAEVENLDSVNELLRGKIEALGHDLRESSARVEEIRSECRETQKALSDELELVRQGRETDASEAAAQATKAKILHNEEMDEVKALLRDAREDLNLERQRNELKILELEKEIKQMCSEREERAKEFLCAQDLSRRLMAVMGVSDTVPGPPNLAMRKIEIPDALTDSERGYYSDKRSRKPHDGNDRRQKRDNGTCEGDEVPTGSFGLGSPGRGGRMPKRSKVHSQAKPPLMQQEKSMTVVRTTKPIKEQDHQQNKRSPLKELVVSNRNGPQTVTPREAYYGAIGRPDGLSIAGSLQLGLGKGLTDTEDFSFDDGEFFTSTPIDQ